MSAERRAELEGEEYDPWGTRDWALVFRPKERHLGLRDRQGRLVAAAGVVIVDVEAGGEVFPVVGLGGVIVNIHHRGQGLARRVVTAALAHAERLGPDFMLLFCHADRVGLYRKLGFTELDDPVTVEQPNGTVAMPMRAMWRSLRPGVTWPPGTVAVRGFPF